MRKRILLVACALLFPVLALADTKVAVIDPIAALQNAEEVKTRIKRMESSFEGEASRLRKMGEEIQRIDERLQREGMTMQTEDRNRLTDQRDAKALEAQSLQQILQRRVKSDQQTLMEDMEPKLIQAIEAVAKEKEVDVVITSQATIYVTPGLDITPDVTARINDMKK